MKKYLLSFFLFPALLHSQSNNGETLKFEIIQATVNFLTTDNTAYKNLQGKSLNCISLDYACIADFCKKNDVSSIQKKVDEWKVKPANTPDEVKKLVAFIVDDLLKKDHRKKLDSFKKYSEKVNQLAASFSTVSEDVADSETTAAETEKTLVRENTPVEFKNESQKEEKSSLPIIALLLSIVSLIASCYAIFKLQIPASSNESKNPDYHNLKDDIKELRSHVAQMQPIDVKFLDEKLMSLGNRLTNIETQRRTVELSVEKKSASVPQHVKEQTLQSSSQILYAKLPDLGNGFGSSILSNNQNGEQIYEIQVSGDKGIFVVSSDINAQKYALSDFNYYLPNACNMLNQPTKGARIDTVKEGTLTKSGGNWIIKDRAQIEFK